MNGYLKTNIDSEIVNLSELCKKNKNTARATIDSLRLNQQETFLFDLLRLVMFTRNESEYLIGYASRAFNPILNCVLRGLDIDEQTYRALYFDEFIKIYKGELRLSDVPIGQRFDRTGYWTRTCMLLVRGSRRRCLGVL